MAHACNLVEIERRVNLIRRTLPDQRPDRTIAAFLRVNTLADRVVQVARRQHEGMAAVRERLLNGVEIEQPPSLRPLLSPAPALAQHRNLKDLHAIQTRHAQGTGTAAGVGTTMELPARTIARRNTPERLSSPAPRMHA